MTVTGGITSSGTNTFSGANTFTGGMVSSHILSKTASYSIVLADADALIIFSGLGAGATATLPDGVTSGMEVWVSDKGDTVNAVTISRQTTAVLYVDAANTGVNTYILSRGEKVRCEFDGTNWYLATNQSRVIGSPAGGDKGVGTINTASGVYDNGNRVWSASATPSAAITQVMMANSAIGQAQLKTTTQQTSSSGATGIWSITFTGGVYTFGYGIECSVAGINDSVVTDSGTNGYVSKIAVNKTNTNPYYFQAQYVQASPPYDLGDGDIPLFVFVLVDSLGNVLMTDTAQDPPWYYNGPNKVTAFKSINNQIVGVRRKVQLTPNGPVVTETPVLTVQDKNLDMNVIPHPFLGNNLTGKTVVLLDPVSKLVQDLVTIHEVQDPTARISDLLVSKKITISNTALTRTTPTGVMAVAPNWKLTP